MHVSEICPKNVTNCFATVSHVYHTYHVQCVSCITNVCVSKLPQKCDQLLCDCVSCVCDTCLTCDACMTCMTCHTGCDLPYASYIYVYVTPVACLICTRGTVSECFV